ncbi:DMT family transporter [Frateuria aurantia]
MAVPAWLALAIAIGAEVIGTSCLKACQGFTQLWPSLGAVAAYALTFYFLSLALKSIPVGVAYAIWSGAGTILLALIGFLVFRQKPDLASTVGMLLIICGVVVIHLGSHSKPS